MSKWWPFKNFDLIALNIQPKYPHSYHHHYHQGTTWSPILWLIFKITWTLSSTTSRALNGLVCFSDKKLTWNKKSPCLGQKHLEKLGVWHWGQLLYHLWWLNLRNQIFNRFWQGIQFSETSSGITTDRGCGAGGDILQYMQVDMQYMQYMRFCNSCNFAIYAGRSICHIVNYLLDAYWQFLPLCNIICVVFNQGTPYVFWTNSVCFPRPGTTDQEVNFVNFVCK